MKIVTKLATLILILSALNAQAQWSNDPMNPLLLCEAEATQINPKIIADNDGGNFIFWLDPRSGLRAIYGQHLDKNGVPAWEADGKLIVSSVKNIDALNVIRNAEGNILLAWYSSGDSLYVQKYNEEVIPLWDKPTIVAGNDLTLTNTFWGPVYQFAMLENGAGCFLAYVLTGWGYDNLLYNKVEGDGSLPWGYNGIQHVDMSPAGIGNLKLFSDGAGGAYMQASRGLFYLSRFDSNGNVIWGEMKTNECTAGTGGTYASHIYYEMQPDGNNGLIAAWTSASDDVFATRIDQDGNFVWDPECNAIIENPDQQEDITFTKSGDGYYATWRDSRIDAPGIYMQKINADGETQWAQPLYIEDTSLYIPVMKSIATSEGDVVVFYQTSWYFAAQKVYADGSTAWPQPIKILETAYIPFYEDYQLFATADNNVIGVAQYNSGLESNIVLFNLNYISGDTLIVDPVEINELKNNSISIFPNPVTNNLFIEAEKQFNHVTITNMQGAIIYEAHQNNVTQQEIVLNQIPSGIYILRLEFDGFETTTKFVKQ